MADLSRCGRGSRLVVVGDHVDDGRVDLRRVGVRPVSPFPTVGAVAAPVVDDVVAVVVEAAGRRETGIAAAVVRDQVVMVGVIVAAPDAAEPMRSLDVTGVIQAFRDHAPLHREVLAVVDRHRLVNAPAGRNMVDYEVLLAPATDRIVIDSRCGAHSHPQGADDDLIGINAQGIVFEADAVSGRGLPGNGDERAGDLQGAFQSDGARIPGRPRCAALCSCRLRAGCPVRSRSGSSPRTPFRPCRRVSVRHSPPRPERREQRRGS